MNSPSSKFLSMPEDIYFVIAAFCNAQSLCSLDATSSRERKLNHSLGLWRNYGAQKFAGIEVDNHGLFIENRRSRIMTKPTPLGARRGFFAPLPSSEMNWKLRVALFSKQVFEFRKPFNPSKITAVENPDEVAYTKCRLRADILTTNPEIALYIEIYVAENADNLSLALVDFDEGGKSSVTFSPDTGAVIKETKIQETPRRVHGSFIQPMKPNFNKFEGKIGLYVKNGQIAFFRKYTNCDWETTGVCVDFSWANGQRLTPCLAFRDEGKYVTSITAVGTTPPFEPSQLEGAFDAKKWQELNWEGTETF